MTTLEDLYYGNIVSVDHSLKQGSAYSEVFGYSVRHQDDLLATLTGQQKEIFEKLTDCESELHGMNERQAFAEGFKLATRLLIKVMQRTHERIIKYQNNSEQNQLKLVLFAVALFHYNNFKCLFC